MKIIYILIANIFFWPVYANQGSVTGLDIPRYVSLKSNDSNLRVGPSKNYPIILKYIVKNLPLRVIEEYDDWRKVEDFDNNKGWIHKSLIKGYRSGIVNSQEINQIEIYNTSDGVIIGSIEVGSVVLLPKCKLNWCLINKDDFKGWIDKKYIWGVEQDEEFKVSYFQVIFDYFFRSINFLEKILK